MPRNPNKCRCAYPGCRAWAMRGGTFCAAHAGHLRTAHKPREKRVPTLEEEITLLAGYRDNVVEWLEARMKDPQCDPAHVLRFLAVLAQVGKSLATMLVQYEALGGAGELERFFEAVARRVEELQPGEKGH